MEEKEECNGGDWNYENKIDTKKNGNMIQFNVVNKIDRDASSRREKFQINPIFIGKIVEYCLRIINYLIKSQSDI